MDINNMEVIRLIMINANFSACEILFINISFDRMSTY
jgi:hypothetical protein